jgi:hypothetical protein
VHQCPYALLRPIQHVVGWVRFRRNTPLAAYAREAAVHEDLCRRLGRPCVLWIATGLLATPEGATHDLDYIALVPARSGPAMCVQPRRCRGRRRLLTWAYMRCRRVPIEVLNLVESTQAAYQDFVPAAAPPDGRSETSSRLHRAFSKLRYGALTKRDGECPCLPTLTPESTASLAPVLAELGAAQTELHALLSERLDVLAERQRHHTQLAAEVAALEEQHHARAAPPTVFAGETQSPPPPLSPSL